MRSPGFARPVLVGVALAVMAWTPTTTAVAQTAPAQAGVAASIDQADATPDGQAVGEQTSGRAVVVIEGGGSPHAYTTPWAACDGGRPQYVQALLDAGLPVFTAPGFGNTYGSTAGESGCPPQPPIEVQWNTSGYPTQAGQAVLGLLGYLHTTYGYRTFDLVGYSYGGLVARATVAALKQRPAAGTMAPAFSYAQVAVDAGVSIPSMVTLNSPHLGGPAYDIAADPAEFLRPVARGWGRQFATSSKSLIEFQRTQGAGSIHVLVTSAHAKRDPASWDAGQVGVLDGVALTLIAGDYCGRTCGDSRKPSAGAAAAPRTDGTVPVYSQLLLPCPKACPSPPGSVFIPKGLVPNGNVVRRTFPTVHSTFVTKGLELPETLSVSRNPAAIGFLVRSVAAQWDAAGARRLADPPQF
jgi:pimeloyl-ACP methyl ester carboxylesterase